MLCITGMAEFQNYAKGSREIGNVFHIEIFDKDKLDSDNAFTTYALWSIEGGVQQLLQVTYNSEDGKPIPDRPATIYEEVIFQAKFGILCIIASLCVITSFVLTYVSYIFRKSVGYNATQPKMNTLVLVGGLLVGGRVLNAAFPISDAQCTIGLWLGHVGFLLVFVTLLVKMWRVYRLIRAGLKKIKITENYVLGVMGVALICMVGYLLILQFVGEPTASTICTEERNQKTCQKMCSFRNPEVHSALFSIEGLLVLVGAILCYQTKGAPDAVNESKYIGNGEILYTIIHLILTATCMCI
jgi:hypothetical protein